MKKGLLVFKNRNFRKGQITRVYMFYAILLAIILIGLPFIAAVVMSILVITIGGFSPLFMIFWAGPAVGIVLYLIVLPLLNITFGFFYDNVETTQKVLGEPLDEDGVRQNVQKSESVSEVKMCELLRPYKVASIGNTTLPAGTKVTFVSENGDKARISYLYNGKSVEFFVARKDIKM